MTDDGLLRVHETPIVRLQGKGGNMGRGRRDPMPVKLCHKEKNNWGFTDFPSYGINKHLKIGHNPIEESMYMLVSKRAANSVARGLPGLSGPRAVGLHPKGYLAGWGQGLGAGDWGRLCRCSSATESEAQREAQDAPRSAASVDWVAERAFGEKQWIPKHMLGSC